MVRSLLLSLLIGLGIALGLASDASAQRYDDQRFFFLRDPFGRGRSLFDFPERRSSPPVRRKRHIETPPDQPVGTVYDSTAEADEQRFIPAREYVEVFGDSLAEQLSQGLADGFISERPEVAIIKKTRLNSGYVRKDVYDWVALAPSLLANEKATAIVVLLGINDRQPLHDDSGAHEFRSNRWKELYIKRIDGLLSELKKKAVPIFVVGLPPVRSPKMMLDIGYINEIFSERTARAGGYYVDVWDGFVTENGDYMATGPALDGQTRRLRASDGIHFTKAGQRKLAHYVERELVRLFDSRPGRGPAVPQGVTPDAAAPISPETPAERPLAGPVLPLSQSSGLGGVLAGASSAPVKAALPTDAESARLLVEGKPAAPMEGRADDFRWSPAAAQAEPAAKPAEAAAAAAPR